MYEQLLRGMREPDFKFTTFEAKPGSNLVTTEGISYYSLCSHHTLPFFGECHISYLPDKTLCGLSKLARTVKHFSAKLQVQEMLTEEIADFLDSRLSPKAV